MTKPSTSQLRAELVKLTVELQSLGVTQLAYPAESINRMPRDSLVSCITWANGTVAHIAETV